MPRSDTPPCLQTARLVLDGHREDDIGAMMGMFGDAAVMRHIGGTALSRQEVFRRLLRYRGTWPVLGYGTWVIRSRENGRFLGQGGFFRDERGFLPPYDAMPEAGWSLLREAQGQGYAGEALAAAFAWLDAAGWTASLCLIAAENARSLQLAERLGFQEARAARLAEDEALVLVRRAYPQDNVAIE